MPRVLKRASQATPSVRVRYLAPRDVDPTIVYQKYYLTGFSELGVGELSGGPLLVRAVPGALMKVRATLRLRRVLRGRPGSGFVGRYLVEGPGGAARVAIDAHDAREIRDREALDWSDVYFKANRWATEEYDPKVAPIVNGNGLLDRRRIERLRQLREARREVDVAFVSRMHAGRPHNLRLFEELARLDCRTDLLAIFPRGFDDDDLYLDRLSALRVTCTRAELPPDELWRRLARARLVLLRSGRHLCISWRMLDLLALGACIVYDAQPLPQWPEPLVPELHYADAGIRRPLDGTAAPDEDYAKLGATIARLLGRPDEAESLRREAARYFDEHAAPARVASYVVEAATRYGSQNSGS